MNKNRREVLDKGYVQLIEHMGSDNSVVDAARVSHKKDSSNFTKEENLKLLKYLAKHQHWSPFEMVSYKFRVKAPIVVAWQWVRHRIASYNFESGRYTQYQEHEFYTPTSIRKKSLINKQSSEGEIHDNELFIGRLKDNYEASYKLYSDILASDGAREIARLALPAFALYTEFIFSVNLRSLINFLKLRLGKDAQEEIRKYAEAIYSIIKEVHPELVGAICEYIEDKTESVQS